MSAYMYCEYETNVTEPTLRLGQTVVEVVTTNALGLFTTQTLCVLYFDSAAPHRT